MFSPQIQLRNHYLFQPQPCQLTQIQNGKCKCSVGKLQNRPVADPILQIREGPVFQKGGLGEAVSKTFFRLFGPQFGLRIKGDPGPSPGSWKECGNFLDYRTTANQWITLLFLDDWVTCKGWIITDHQSSCYTVSSVYESVNDGWVTCIG